MGKSEDMMGNSQQLGLAEAVLIVTAGEENSGKHRAGMHVVPRKRPLMLEKAFVVHINRYRAAKVSG